VIGDEETRILNAVSFTATHDFGPLTFTSISSFKHFETQQSRGRGRHGNIRRALFRYREYREEQQPLSGIPRRLR
jgi:hypothetical protein